MNVKNGSLVQISNDGLGNRTMAKMRLLLTVLRAGTHFTGTRIEQGT